MNVTKLDLIIILYYGVRSEHSIEEVDDRLLHSTLAILLVRGGLATERTYSMLISQVRLPVLILLDITSRKLAESHRAMNVLELNCLIILLRTCALRVRVSVFSSYQ